MDLEDFTQGKGPDLLESRGCPGAQEGSTTIGQTSANARGRLRAIGQTSAKVPDLCEGADRSTLRLLTDDVRSGFLCVMTR